MKTSENDETEWHQSKDSSLSLELSKQKDEDKQNEDEKEGRKRTLSISNFEPVLPGRKLLNCNFSLQNYLFIKPEQS